MSILGLERLATAWTRRLALLGGWLLLGIALVTVVDALRRYFLGRPLPGTFEATELLLAVVIFFGMPYTGLSDGHVAVDLFTARLGPRTQHAIAALNALVCAVLLGYITVQMAALAAEFLATGRTTITIRLPIFPFLLPVTAAAGLATLGFLVQAAGAAWRVCHPDLPLLSVPSQEGER